MSELYSMTATCQFHLFSFILFFTSDICIVYVYHGHGYQGPASWKPGFHVDFINIIQHRLSIHDSYSFNVLTLCFEFSTLG